MDMNDDLGLLAARLCLISGGTEDPAHKVSRTKSQVVSDRFDIFD